MMASAILTELRTIQRKHKGLLRPADVEAFARDPNTALHSRFTWDNSAAAYRYRLHQARNLIRVTVGVIPGTDKSNRIFVSMKADRLRDGGGYRATATVMGDREQRDVMLAEALEELEVFRRKYRRLRELSAVFAEIDAVLPRRRVAVG